MFCSSSTLATHSHESKKGARSAHGSPISGYRERKAFLKKYESMSLDEVSAALMVTFEDLVSTFLLIQRTHFLKGLPKSNRNTICQHKCNYSVRPHNT